VRLSRAAVAAALAVSAMLTGVATLPETAAATSPLLQRPFVAPGGATALTLAVTPGEVATGRAVTLSGRLYDPATGLGSADDDVRLEVAAADGTWTELALLRTDGSGHVTAAEAPAATTTYRLHHGDLGSGQESVSPVVQVTVRPLTARFSRDGVQVGRAVAVRGVLAADPGSWVRLELFRDRRWRVADRARTAADGSYSFTVTPTQTGFSRYRVVRDAGVGRPRSVAALPPLDAFRLHTYSVTTRGTVRADVAAFRSVVAATYADPHGWRRGHHRFQEVRRGGDFTVVLAQARYLPAYSWECSTTYSCRVGRFVIINQDRWRGGSRHFSADLLTYRRMLVNHETGHWLGRGHAYCPRPGAPAPVMQQQSKGLQGCQPNPWPLGREIAAVS